MRTIQDLLNKEFEELTFEEKMVLALREALDQIKVETDETRKAFLGAMIGQTSIKLKEAGIKIF